MILQDGMTLHYEGLADIEVIATPGHSPSCITYKIGNGAEIAIENGSFVTPDTTPNGTEITILEKKKEQ